MPKLFLPPQGGEKWLCIFTFLFMMLRYSLLLMLLTNFHNFQPQHFVWGVPIIDFEDAPLMLILSKMFHRPFSSVVCTVVMIYCIVIIYLPSMVEAETNFIVSVITIIALSYLLSSLSFFLAGEITQVLESISWVRCASGNVSSSQSSF